MSWQLRVQWALVALGASDIVLGDEWAPAVARLFSCLICFLLEKVELSTSCCDV